MIAVSRDGFRNIITVLVGAAAFAALLRWGDRPNRTRAITAGFIVALGFWTYQPLKLLPVLAILWMVWMRAHDRERFQRLRPTLIASAVSFLVVVSPMVYTAITDASGYFGRAAAVSLFNPAVRYRRQLPGPRAANARDVPLHGRPQRSPRRERAATARSASWWCPSCWASGAAGAGAPITATLSRSSGCPCSCCRRSSPPRAGRRTSCARSAWSPTSRPVSASGAWSS